MKLGDISFISYGYTAKASSEIIGPKFLRITDIQDGQVDWKTVPSCSIDDANFIKYQLQKDDIVFARTGATTGKSYRISDLPNSVAASYLIRLRLLDQNVLPSFVSLFFQSAEYWDAVEAGTTGSAQGGFNASKLRNLILPKPPLPEQNRIVAILDEAFEGIAAAAANAEKNLANARELFKSNLNSVFTQKGEGWAERTLRQVSADFGRGKSKHRPRNDPKLYEGTYPFIQTGDVRNCDHRIVTKTQSYNEIGLAQSKLWPKGTICITIAANIAETGILDFDACFPDSIIGVVVDETQTTNDFIEYLLQSVKARIKAKGKGSAQDNINLTTFENEKFLFPGLEEQEEIVIRLNSLSASTIRLEASYRQKLAALLELKQSILKRAFLGELTAQPDQELKVAIA